MLYDIYMEKQIQRDDLQSDDHVTLTQWPQMTHLVDWVFFKHIMFLISVVDVCGSERPYNPELFLSQSAAIC